MNQCDGCRRGLPLENGIHRGEGYDLIGCTRELYRTPKVAVPFWHKKKHQSITLWHILQTDSVCEDDAGVYQEDGYLLPSQIVDIYG